MISKRLFIFDMDGTLIPRSTALLEISKQTGHFEEFEELEKQLIEKRINNHNFATRVHSLWGKIPHEKIKNAFLNSPKLENIDTVLKYIKAHGGTSCLITMAPHFFADHFFDYGFDHIFASRVLNIQEGTLHLEHLPNSHDKPRIAQELCQKLGIDFSHSIAFGDSISDEPLFETLTHTVAVNGDEYIKRIAKYNYEGLDLMQAFTLALGGKQQRQLA